MKNLETEISETLFLELNISNKKWAVAFAYKPPNSSNKTLYLDNILLIGDFNINIPSNRLETWKHLKDFSDIFSRTSLVNTATCCKSARGTAIDVMLKKRPNSFKYTCAITTSLNDCHKLILSSLRALCRRLPPKQVI